VARCLFLALLWLGWLNAQAPPAPPEEDEIEKARVEEYTLNPLQAQKELKIGNFYFKKATPSGYRAAAKRFEEATKWDPNFAEAFLRLGEAQEKLKNREAARAAFEKYLALAPDAKNAAAIRKRVKS
jgi:outer membrane protein assembly factor BamD (BamD/ComL family)